MPRTHRHQHAAGGYGPGVAAAAGHDPNWPAKRRAQSWVLLGGLVLMAVKFLAWWLTDSAAILTDALESVVNVVASMVALIGIRYAARPRDADHPYGHGKVEYFLAGLEGALLVAAAISIYSEAVRQFVNPTPITNLGLGLALTTVGGVGNGLMGWYLVRVGRRTHSLALQGDGRHLMSDALTSAGLVAGLGLVWATGWAWVDSVLAMGLGLIILYAAYGLLRRAWAGLMDERDQEALGPVFEGLKAERRPEWVDLRHLRVLQHGDVLHVDGELVLPYYWTLDEAQGELDRVRQRFAQQMDRRLELSIQKHPCHHGLCFTCGHPSCPHRAKPQQTEPKWTISQVTGPGILAEDHPAVNKAIKDPKS